MGIPYISRAPRKTTHKSTEAQKLARGRFKEASVWAREIIKDPVNRQYFQSKVTGCQTAYTAAISEYLRNEKQNPGTIPSLPTGE